MKKHPEQNPKVDLVLAAQGDAYAREDLAAAIDATKRQLRETNAEFWGELAADPQRCLLAAIKASSQRTYASNRNSVVGRGFPWTVDGLWRFFRSPDVAKCVSNSYCESILSTFKLTTAIEGAGQVLNPADENLLRLTIRARKNVCPDFPRIVGAITFRRLQQLHAMYEAKLASKQLSPEDFQELVDASTLLYCCALRIFQLRALTADRFWFSESNEKVAWVSVPAKCTRNGQFSEHKLVHEDFRPIVQDILERRKGHTLLFPRWAKLENESDAESVRLENLMMDLNKEAANLFQWPAAQSFHGTHNFRHGAAQDAFAKGGARLVMMRTGHLSAGCANYYARSDLERDRRAAFARVSEKKKPQHIKQHLEQIQAQVEKMRQTFKLDKLFPESNEEATYPNLAALDEKELEDLKNHIRNQSQLIKEVKTLKRNLRRPRVDPAPDPFSVPASQLAWPVEDCTVVEVMHGGYPIKFLVPNPVVPHLPQNCNKNMAKDITARILYHIYAQRASEEQRPRQELLNKNLYPGVLFPK